MNPTSHAVEALLRKVLDKCGLALKADLEFMTVDRDYERAYGNEKAEQLASLQSPADGVPFCVDCHKGIKRGMPYHILTIRHGDCRFVDDSSLDSGAPSAEHTGSVAQEAQSEGGSL